MLQKLNGVVFVILSMWSLFAYSDKLCFAFAYTYYEQLYCEIKAKIKPNKKTKSKALPAFYEFQRNNATTQALLLKRFSRETGVQVNMPPKEVKKNSQRTSRPIVQLTKAGFKNNALIESVDLEQECNVGSTTIRCSGRVFRVVGNKANDELDSGVFAKENTMDMPVFKGTINDIQAVDKYLQNSYEHYLQKMLDIGLGGSTLSFGKFSYLFDDLADKEVDFAERFEKMYFYLKRDKQRLAVNADAALPSSLGLTSCYYLTSMFVCTVGTKNYILLPVKE